MKNINRVLAAGTVVALVAIGSTVRAQTFNSSDDGIAASPKLRAQLNERRANAGFPAAVTPRVVAVTSQFTPAVSIAASPKVAQMFAEREASKKVSPSPAIASTTTVPGDGIAASPKLRQQLNERAQVIQIAPIK